MQTGHRRQHWCCAGQQTQRDIPGGRPAQGGPQLLFGIDHPTGIGHSRSVECCHLLTLLGDRRRQPHPLGQREQHRQQQPGTHRDRRPTPAGRDRTGPAHRLEFTLQQIQRWTRRR
ncbi:MAG TPA: hypothetical protein DDZ76_13555 [Xanthomonadales bacterium]|nr:hypothetical protein [Xanthomonadales bacterium]